MGKGKNLNPADAYRKAQRKKELKKNKAERAKARDFALVKKDTRDLEDEIEKLQASAELSASDKSHLTNLKNELTKIAKRKDEYVKEHPEQRRLVYRPRKEEKGGDQKVMNPYGVPPPGMPYVERPLTADEVDSGEDTGAEDSDEDIVMPEGQPPGAGLEDPESVSEDDIPMPEGPPPSNMSKQNHQALPSTIPSSFPPPLPYIPLSTPSFMLPPPPQPGSSGNVYTSIPGVIPPPPPPPGFFPRRFQSAAVIQDPLSYIPHQTYQAHHASRLPPGHPSLPPKPHTGGPGTIPATGVTISAGPELRDLKKEATAFVPASLKRKRGSGVVPSSSKVDAAPSVNVSSEETFPQARPDLVGVLKSQFGAVTAPSSNSPAQDKGPKALIVKERDDYRKFVDEMSDLLGPPDN